MSIHFKCKKCKTGVKAPSELAGHAAKCPKCRQHTIIPAPSIERTPSWTTDDPRVINARSARKNTWPKATGNAQVTLPGISESSARTTAQAHQNRRPAYSNVVDRAKRLGEAALTMKILRKRYEKLEHERRIHLLTAVLCGVPGLTLWSLMWWGLPEPKNLIFGIVGLLLAVIGCTSFAKYKGRSIGWGLLAALTVWPLMIFLHDANKDRIDVIEAQLEAFSKHPM